MKHKPAGSGELNRHLNHDFQYPGGYKTTRLHKKHRLLPGPAQAGMLLSRLQSG